MKIIQTKLNKAMTQHCQAAHSIDNILKQIQQKLIISTSNPFTIESSEGYNSDGDWTVQIYIKYPTIIQSDIETSYETLQTVKQIFREVENSQIKYTQSVTGLSITVNIDGEVDIHD